MDDDTLVLLPLGGLYPLPPKKTAGKPPAFMDGVVVLAREGEVQVLGELLVCSRLEAAARATDIVAVIAGMSPQCAEKIFSWLRGCETAGVASGGNFFHVGGGLLEEIRVVDSVGWIRSKVASNAIVPAGSVVYQPVLRA